MTIEVEGKDLHKLSNEAGGHRIQRVPPTERKGRVHTSTVTVAVIDPQKKKEIVWSDKDFKVEWYSGTGAGGQHRNKHQNSCRITHIDSGAVATAQCRSRENSLNEAKTAILARLNNIAVSEQQKQQSQEKKEQVGSGMRGDKIRTYMDQHGIVKDHRTEKSASFNKIMSGNFDLLW